MTGSKDAHPKVREALLARIAELEKELRHWQRELKKLERLPLEQGQARPVRPAKGAGREDR